MSPTNIHPITQSPDFLTAVVGCAALDSDHLIADLGGRTLLMDRTSGEVRASFETVGLHLMGVDTYGLVAIFSEDLSWNIQVYDLCERRWLENTDPDFPRFVLEEDGDMAWVADVETGARYGVVELLSAEELRRSA